MSGRGGELHGQNGAVDAFQARAALQDAGFRDLLRGAGNGPMRGGGRLPALGFQDTADELAPGLAVGRAGEDRGQ